MVNNHCLSRRFDSSRFEPTGLLNQLRQALMIWGDNTRSRSGEGLELGQGRCVYEAPSRNDHHIVDRLLDFTKHVRRHQYRSPLPGEIPKKISQPSDAFWV